MIVIMPASGFDCRRWSISADDGDPLAELDEQRLEVEDDVAFRRSQRCRSSLSTLIRFRCVAVMVRTQSSWALGRSSKLLRYPVGADTHGAGDRSGQGLLVGREPLLERRLDVDVREQLVDERGRDLVLGSPDRR